MVPFAGPEEQSIPGIEESEKLNHEHFNERTLEQLKS
jgi:hypothetical protein